MTRTSSTIKSTSSSISPVQTFVVGSTAGGQIEVWEAIARGQLSNNSQILGPANLNEAGYYAGSADGVVYYINKQGNLALVAPPQTTSSSMNWTGPFEFFTGGGYGYGGESIAAITPDSTGVTLVAMIDAGHNLVGWQRNMSDTNNYTAGWTGPTTLYASAFNSGESTVAAAQRSSLGTADIFALTPNGVLIVTSIHKNGSVSAATIAGGLGIYSSITATSNATSGGANVYAINGNSGVIMAYTWADGSQDVWTGPHPVTDSSYMFSQNTALYAVSGPGGLDYVFAAWSGDLTVSIFAGQNSTLINTTIISPPVDAAFGSFGFPAFTPSGSHEEPYVYALDSNSGLWVFFMVNGTWQSVQLTADTVEDDQQSDSEDDP
ncbi:hypothetical protein ANO11243_071430 [Dothideomycetidae sp. 11243]|nr:hypothetical protein ANO11243_071430 [fungal sp. No.11243]